MGDVCARRKKGSHKRLRRCVFEPGSQWLSPRKARGHITEHGVRGQSQWATRYRRSCVLAELPLGFLLCKTSASLCCFDKPTAVFLDQHTPKTVVNMCQSPYLSSQIKSVEVFDLEAFHFRLCDPDFTPHHGHPPSPVAYLCNRKRCQDEVWQGCIEKTHRHRHTHTDTLIHLRPCARNVHFIDHPAHVTETIDASYITWCCMETHTRLSSFKLAEVSTLVSRFFWSPRASLNVHPSTWLMPNPMKFLRLVLSERLACVQVSPSATVCQLVCLCWHLNQNNYRLPQLCVTMATFPSSHQSYLWW